MKIVMQSYWRKVACAVIGAEYFKLCVARK